MHYQHDVPHTAHLIAALMTFGLWLVIYGVDWIMREPWRCEECGKKEPTIAQAIRVKKQPSKFKQLDLR
jgi:hypothetical protein